MRFEIRKADNKKSRLIIVRRDLDEILLGIKI